jgi:hypothetical protein
MLSASKPDNVACVFCFTLLHSYQLEVSVDHLVPHFDCWTEVALSSEYLPAPFLCVDPNLGHLFVELSDH